MNQLFKKIQILIIFCIICQIASAQNIGDDWALLQQITFENKYNELYGFEMESPLFSKRMKKLEGQKMCFEGNVLDTIDNIVFLSKEKSEIYFLCGRGKMDPTKIISVFLIKNEAKFNINEKIKVCGKLKLDSNIDKTPYNLIEAKIIK
jgi:hypothetical protein